MSSKREQRFLLINFSLGHFANDWVAGTIWLLTPAIATAMNLSPAEIGLLLTINGIGAGLAYIPAGIFADHIRKRGLLLLITFWWVAIGYFIASLAPGFWSLTLLLTIAVMGDAAWHPVATGILVQRMPQRRAQVLGIHAMGGTLGADVLAPLSIGLLLSIVDWRTALQISVLPAVIMGICFIPLARKLIEPEIHIRPPLNLQDLLKLWSGRQGYSLISMMVFYNMALMAALSMTPLFLQSHYDFTALQTAIVFAVMLLAGSLLQPLVGHTSDRLGRKPVLVTMLLAGSLFAVMVAIQDTLIVLILSLIAAAAFLAGVRSVVLATAVEYTAERESTTLGITFALMDGVGAFGALLAGIAASQDLSYAFWVAAGLALLAAVVASRLHFTTTFTTT